MRLLDSVLRPAGKALTQDLKRGATKSLDRVAYIAGAAVLLAVLLGALALYFGVFK